MKIKSIILSLFAVLLTGCGENKDAKTSASTDWVVVQERDEMDDRVYSATRSGITLPTHAVKIPYHDIVAYLLVSPCNHTGDLAINIRFNKLPTSRLSRFRAEPTAIKAGASHAAAPVRIRWDDEKPDDALMNRYKSPDSLGFWEDSFILSKIIDHDSLLFEYQRNGGGVIRFNFDLTDAERAITESLKICEYWAAGDKE